MSQYYINTFELDTTDLGAVGQTRQIKITGDVGAEFYLQVINISILCYIFKSYIFTTLKQTLFLLDLNLKKIKKFF